MKLGKYSFGIGDRFGRQGKAQLRAIIKAKEQGIDIVPVWNKSHREHTIIKTSPDDVRAEADDAVNSLGWKELYYVDDDHIGLVLFHPVASGNTDIDSAPFNVFGHLLTTNQIAADLVIVDGGKIVA